MLSTPTPQHLTTLLWGYQAGYYNSTGTSNVFIGGHDAGGFAAGLYNTTGSYNTMVGAGALKSNTTASYNTAVGYQAGYSSTTGYSQVAVGRGALYSNTDERKYCVGHMPFIANYNGVTTTLLVGRLACKYYWRCNR
jgi:trimeric autotransporter adhesin